MHLSQTAQYALRALLHIELRTPHFVPVGELAGPVGAHANYLSKTLHQLVRAGILTSCRGPAGGFKLAVPADSLTMSRVVAVFTAPASGLCLLDGGMCTGEVLCAVHRRWREVAQPMDAFFNTTTIADLRADARPSSETSQPHTVNLSTRGLHQ